ncbi:uncharacterized protein [Lolium perenne]|uniref:uncharacterized protein isoform X2 n=1 Tax=Lolium perenne TaxID=4522 RepID=UPI003A9A4ECF
MSRRGICKAPESLKSSLGHQVYERKEGEKPTKGPERKKESERTANMAAAAASPTHRASLQATSTPPYPSAARIADSSCFPQYTASLKCLETSQDKSKCQQQFDDYKECKKKEREARLERNRSRTLFG